MRMISRLYGIILRDQMEGEYNHQEEDEPAGFRDRRSCTNNVFYQACKKRYKCRYISDDGIPNIKLWTTLKQTRLNHTLLMAVQYLYRNLCSSIKMGNRIILFPFRMGFADDQVVYAEDKDDLKYITQAKRRE